jgi:hypothetical protein
MELHKKNHIIFGRIKKMVYLYYIKETLKQKRMTKKEAATIMTRTFEQHKYWWKSAKNEKASKEFLKAREIYKKLK